MAEINSNLIQFQSSIRTTRIHQEYNQRLNSERESNERLQVAVFDAEARLLKASELFRQAHIAGHESDQSVNQALSSLQAQNKGLRQALNLPVPPSPDPEKDLIFSVEESE